MRGLSLKSGRPESRFKWTRGACEVLLAAAPFRAWPGSAVRIARGSNRPSRRPAAQQRVRGSWP